MKKLITMKNNFKILFLAVLAMSVLFVGCKKEDEPEKPDTATKRYETVPFVKSKSVKNGDFENLVYTDYDDEYNYYFFVLGYVKSTPLAYKEAYYYNGVTSLTIKYSRTNVTQETIKHSVTKASSSSTTNTHSTNYSNKVGVSSDFGIKFKKIFELGFKASYEHSWGGSDGTSETNSRSFSDTYETSYTNTSSTNTEESYVIGNKSEPSGMYRWSLFSICDVYYVIKTDRAKTRIIEANTVYCARPSQYWVIDYDPEEGGTFGKTVSSTLLQFPVITNVSQLPNVEECTHQWGPWIVTTPPTTTTEGIETRTCSLCQRAETRPIPVLEMDLKILFYDYQNSATTNKDYFCKGQYRLGIEIGIEGDAAPLIKHPESSEYHYYGEYDDNLKNHKTVVRTYPISLQQTKIKISKDKSFYIKFKTQTKAHRYWWVIVAIFGPWETSTGEYTVFFDYNSATGNWVARGSSTNTFATFVSLVAGTFTFTHSFNYLMVIE